MVKDPSEVGMKPVKHNYSINFKAGEFNSQNQMSFIFLNKIRHPLFTEEHRDDATRKISLWTHAISSKDHIIRNAIRNNPK